MCCQSLLDWFFLFPLKISIREKKKHDKKMEEKSHPAQITCIFSDWEVNNKVPIVKTKKIKTLIFSSFWDRTQLYPIVHNLSIGNFSDSLKWAKVLLEPKVGIRACSFVSLTALPLTTRLRRNDGPTT